MTKVYKTARGKMVDIDQVKLANESIIAVGNMKVNARGDLLGAGGQVAMGRNQLMDQVYAVESDDGYSPNDPKNFAARQAMIEASNAKELTDLSNNLTTPISDVVSVAPVNEVRGSLASAVAKQTTVVQEPIADPRIKKPSGPSRI